MKYNHHYSGILASHKGRNDSYFLFEQKDPTYIFPNCLTLFGGNWQKGLFEEKNPLDTLFREIKEEFWIEEEEWDKLSNIIPGYHKEADNPNRPKGVEEICHIGRMLLNNPQYQNTFSVQMREPTVPRAHNWLASIYATQLNSSDFEYMHNVISSRDGVITPDNYKWGSKAVILSEKELVPDRFSWGFEQILSTLIPTNLGRNQDGTIVVPLYAPVNLPYLFFESKGHEYRIVEKSD